MRIRRRHQVRPSREITGVYCCQAVRDIERVETHAETVTFTLACGHTVTLVPGLVYGLHVHKGQHIVYPNQEDLPTRQERI